MKLRSILTSMAFILMIGLFSAGHLLTPDKDISVSERRPLEQLPKFSVQALMNGQIDCVIIDNAPAQEFVKSNPGLTILDGHWAEEDYAIGVDKGNTVLLDAINKALAELIADGTVQSIIDKYIH